MTPKTRVQRNPDLIAADLDDETVMMDIDSGQYFALNPVGAHVWAVLENPATVEAVINSVCTTFDVDGAGNVDADVSVFLSELVENKLILVVTA